MLKFIRDTVPPVGFAGSLGLSMAITFVPSEWRLFVFISSFLLFVVTLLLVLVLNKLMFGVYLAGRRLPPEQIDAMRQAARKRARQNSLFAVLSLAVIFPIIFLMTKFGWSRNSTRAVLLIVGVVLGLLFTVASAKYGQKRS